MEDVFFDARNYLVVGNFKQAFQEAELQRPFSKSRDEVDNFNAEKLLIQVLASIGLQEGKEELNIAVEIPKVSSHPYHDALRAWISFLRSAKQSSKGFFSDEKEVRDALDILMEKSAEIDFSNTQMAIFCVSALIMIRDYAGSLTIAKKWLNSMTEMEDEKMKRERMELHYLVVEALLRINRSDEAKKEVNIMENIDDESVFTVLASGLVMLYSGQASCEEQDYKKAIAYFQYAIERFNNSPMLSNLCAIAYMGTKNFEAKRMLQEAEDRASSSSYDFLTSFNTATVKAHEGEFSSSFEFTDLLREASKDKLCGWAADCAEAEKSIDAAFSRFKSK